MADFVEDSHDMADLARRIHRLADALRAKLMTDPVQTTPSKIAVIFFFGRFLKTYQAAIELLRMGFWQDAAVLARVLREAEYQVRWIVTGGDETARLFLQDYQRNRRKVLRTVAEHGDPEIRVKAQEIVEGTAADETLDEWWRNWWSSNRNEGIGWLAEKVGHQTAHRFEYVPLSAFVHTSPALMDFYFHEPTDAVGVVLESRPGISLENREFANLVVFSIFAASADICGAFAQHMGFGFEDELAQVGDQIRQFASDRPRPQE
jgi:hypothetical protein